MGRKGNWFSNVKKALSPDSKDNKEEKSSKSKKKWFGKPKHPSSGASTVDPSTAATPPLPQEEAKVTDVEIEHHIPAAVPAAPPPEPPVAAIAPPAAAAPEAVVVAVQATTRVSRFVGRSGEEAAATKIQTAFRGYLSRRALRALRGLVRLKLLMEGSVVKRQATNTLKCMQTLSRVQTQIRSRRIRMLEENQALQRQLLQKHAKELENLRLGEEWDDSLQSKEQIEANLLNKHEASVRRERALAYAFSHQQTLKNPTRSANPMFMDPRNPTWGWSWLERWMAARPWENKDLSNNNNNNNKDDGSSVSSSRARGGVGEINKSYARYLLNSDKLSSPTAAQKLPPPAFHSPSTPTRPTPTKKVKSSASPRVHSDARSVHSDRSNRRHTIAGGSPSLRDDEETSPALPSYMVPTESARAKSRLNGGAATPPPDSAKKRLSFPASPGSAARPRRHSGPPKVDGASSVAASVTTENNESTNNGMAVA